jgi:formate hydrogenlyase subunit 3/multisubunit Na+/H+ antiporter MnhD subunit
MLAIVQHNIKKCWLQALEIWESLIGIGMGCYGAGSGIGHPALFGGSAATLNPACSKSCYVYGAATLSTHPTGYGTHGGWEDLRHLLFLIAALAICGLPPFNGFVSEFLIYNGMFSGLGASGFQSIWALIFAIFGLALIGGMALFCFTKAYGIMFLGTPRANLGGHPGNEGRNGLIPMYVLTALILPGSALSPYPQIVQLRHTDLSWQNCSRWKPSYQTELGMSGHIIFILACIEW